MASPAQLLLKANAEHWVGTYCEGHDPFADLSACVCPELAIELTVELIHGASKRMRWVCSCCYRLFPLADKRNPSPLADPPS